MTMSAEKGGENMSENIRNGFVSWIHSKGYGFAECDDDEIEDSFIPPNLIEKHDLSDNDEIEYIVGETRKGEAVVEIISINNTLVVAKKKVTKNSPRRSNGSILRLTKSGSAILELDDFSDEILCNKKYIKKYNISVGDELEITFTNISNGKYFNFEVSNVHSLNGEIVRDKVPSKIVKAVKNLLFKPQKKLTKLFLSFTSGGDDEKIIEMYAGAQESLKPFIEYADNSIEAAKNQRETLRFRWEEVKKPKSVKIIPNFTKITVDIESFEYTTNANIAMNERLITDNDTLNRISKTGPTDENGMTPFSTESPLEDSDEWQRIEHNLENLSYTLASSFPQFRDVLAKGSSKLQILEQAQLKNKIQMLLQPALNPNEKLLFDGNELNFTIVPQEFFSQLNDQNGAQVLISGQTNTVLEVPSLPATDLLFDQNLLPYYWKLADSSSKRHTIKLILHEAVEKQLDPSNDDDPYDWIFSPNRELYELEIEGKKFVSDKIKIYNKKGNTKTVQVDELPPKDSVLTSAPRTRLIRAQRDMLNELMNHSLPHNEALLKLLAPGDENERTMLWNNSSPNALNTEPNWAVLTGNASGTETQKEMVRIALESTDLTVLQGPPGSGKSTTILEFVYQSILRGENILLCGSTQASIDNVLGRILDDLTLSNVISPIRIGSPDNIYDEKIKKITLANQKTNWESKFGLDSKEAKDFILSSSNLTCGTMESILGHPWIMESRRDGIESRGTNSKIVKSPQPHWDVLIIDESSKTTFNEFIVPAMFCKKFVLVGDIRQLPPFTQESEFIANLESIKGFNKNKQRSMLLHSHLSNIKKFVGSDESLLMVEHDDTVSGLIQEIFNRKRLDERTVQNNLVFFSSRKPDYITNNVSDKSFQVFTPNEVLESPLIALNSINSGLLIMDQTSAKMLQKIIPPMPVIFGPKVDEKALNVLKRRATDYRRHSKFENYNLSSKKGKKIVEIEEWSSQVSWRLARLSELKISDSNNTKKRYKKALGKLLPVQKTVKNAIDQIQLIALPSVMECLQEGFRSLDDSPTNLQSTLTHGFPKESFDQVRFKMLDYQHRMESEISEFPRVKYYEGKALKDADTISLRNQKVPFTYRNDEPAALWQDVNGKEDQGANREEVEAIKKELQEIFDWARKNPRNDRTPWSVAVLTPYGKQNFNLLQMAKRITGMKNEFRFDLTKMEDPAPVNLVVSSTDKYQGQEADIVLISLVKVLGHGFLDSWNRMNVAITRAKRKRIIFGKYNNFVRTDDEMLNDLAKSHAGKSLIMKERDV